MRMLNRTLILLLIISIFSTYSIADDYEPLTKYEIYVNIEYNKTVNAARGVDLAHGEMTDLAGKYNASEAAISSGNTQTVAAAFGVTVTAFATGGSSVAWSGIVAAVTSGLKTAQAKQDALTAYGGQSLLGAYESAIQAKRDAVVIFENQVQVYNMMHLAYSQIYNGHYTIDII